MDGLHIVEEFGNLAEWFHSLSEFCCELGNEIQELSNLQFSLENVGLLGGIIDQHSQQLIPGNMDDKLAIRTTGDGNCCFRTASILCGRQDRNIELRVRTVIELAKHSVFYLGDEHLIARIQAQERFLGGNPDSASSDISNPGILTAVFEAEVMNSCTCRKNTWASMWHLQALSSVLGRIRGGLKYGNTSICQLKVEHVIIFD